MRLCCPPASAALSCLKHLCLMHIPQCRYFSLHLSRAVAPALVVTAQACRHSFKCGLPYDTAAVATTPPSCIDSQFPSHTHTTIFKHTPPCVFTHHPAHPHVQELWTELKSEEELQAAFGSLPAGKMLLVDYYASWCAVCKTAYPGLSRLAANKEHLQHFVFAKASLDQQEIKDHIKREGVRGIPHLSIYNSKGAKLLGMGASFKRLEAISFNLRAAAAHKDEVMQQKLQLQLDPNCFVLIPGAPVTAA
eukprot:GHUV01007962.1.p1 GENE.GHUV01007962.1~~GHUV01007962.1.p1  ORF type:complete len:249 (+),score=42.58 GHUV01007962.1:576-1322(+)